MKTEYELVLILSPEFSDSVAKDFLKDFEERILKSEKTFFDFWGRKRLAYQIKKQEFGIYAVICFLSEGDKISELEKDIFLEKNILRHLIIKTPAHVQKNKIEDIEKWNNENIKSEKPKTRPKRIKARPKRKFPSKEYLEKKEDKKSNKKDIDHKKLDDELNEILDN